MPIVTHMEAAKEVLVESSSLWEASAKHSVILWHCRDFVKSLTRKFW